MRKWIMRCAYCGKIEIKGLGPPVKQWFCSREHRHLYDKEGPQVADPKWVFVVIGDFSGFPNSIYQWRYVT